MREMGKMREMREMRENIVEQSKQPTDSMTHTP